MRLTCVVFLHAQKAAFSKVSFVFTSLTYKNVQCFRYGMVHEFYSLKASLTSKVHASSHEYPHVEKNQEPLRTEFQRQGKQQAIG